LQPGCKHMHLQKERAEADIGREGRTVLTATPNTVARASLDQIVCGIGDLPSSPAIVSAVMGMASDLNTQLAEIGKVVSADQSLTVKVLRLSNSSFYGRMKQVSTVEQAIVTLGYYTLRSLVVASSTHSIYRKKDPARFLPVLWEHSLGSAVAARLLGRRIRHPQTEEAFIGGLLHDVGKLVLTQNLQGDFKALRTDAETDGDWCRAERAMLGFTHIDVGVALLTKWNFPRTLIDAIALHHTEPECQPDEPSTLPALIWLANQIARPPVPTADAVADPDWTARFFRANVRWPADQIAAFLAQYQEQLAQERWLFSSED
jgi:putative nucleotidyltransferase with HDIG domain